LFTRPYSSFISWYDKLQLIVCKDGTAGCNFEHSAIDGHTALRFVSDVFAETVISFAESIVDLIHGRGRIQHVVEARLKRAASIIKHEDDRTLDVYPKRIVFDLSEAVMDRIYFAETALCDDVSSSDTFVLEFMNFGKLLIVANQLSPDSVVQMAIMIAYYRLYGKVVCTYEPVLTKSFYHGRTEAMRSATPLSKRLCEVWCRKGSTKDEKLHALRDATAHHSRLVAECAKGRGVDRHLFSLKCIAERKGMPTPAFFRSEAWKTLNHTILSTSNCGNPALRLFGFGPVVPDGFGVGYIIKDNGLSFSVSSKHRQTQRYVRALRTTLIEVEDLLQKHTLYQVQTRSISLREQQKQKHRHHQIFSYDDVYGESSATIPEHRPVVTARAALPVEPGGDRHRKKSTGSKFFTQVREKELSVGDFDEPGVHINLDLDGKEREDSGH
jgi:carnitine O-acetyltransferase